MKVYLWPEFAGEDQGDGGIRRVVEGQRTSLPRQGVKFVDTPADADLIACHIEIPEEFLRKFPDKPMVNHCHGLYWNDYEWEDWAYKANRKVLRSILSADVTTAPTEWVANVIRRHTSRDVRVVPHGISLREWQAPVDHKGYVLWNKTRIDPVCEIDSLSALVRISPDFEFVSTYGDKAPNMTLTGTLPFKTAKELVRSAMIYLCTTRETFGVGTLEAMACGVPVVGFNFGGQAEYVEHEVDGYLVQPGDIQELRNGLEYVRLHRERMSLAAIEKAKQFTWAEVTKGYKDLYREMIDRYEQEEDRPRVTFVVPAYKLERYLPETLESIQTQTEKEWECIVVDDASPDQCGKIADDFAARDPRFRVIHNTENLYLAEARNVAIAQAKGRYIFPVDADDKLPKDAAEILADELDRDRTLQAVYGNVLFVNEDGHTPTDYRVASQSPGHSGWPMVMDPVKQVSGANLMPYASMYRRDVWKLLGGYRRRLRTSEDADFWTRLASYGFRAERVTNADTLIYRNREGSMSRENEGHRYDYLRWFPWSKDLTLAPAGLSGEKGIALLPGHVSVVIPVGPGHERYVYDAVDSVAAQSYQYWECIVVNDSGRPLPPLPTWVRVIPCDARDVSVARNLGVQAASGSLFLPLDADDFLQPDALQWLVSAHIERNGAIIYPDFFEDPHEEGVFTPYRLPDWNCEHLTRKGTIASVTALTPVSVWRDVGGYTPGINWEDWDFQLKCAEKGFCSARLAAPLFTYRKWTGTRRSFTGPDDFETRKGDILKRWADYFEGRKQFMACGCSQGGTVVPPSPETAAAMASRSQFGEFVMVQYTGEKVGGVTYKGLSQRFYQFAKGDPPKYVSGEDAQMFAMIRDFRIIADAQTDNTPSQGEPVLVA